MSYLDFQLLLYVPSEQYEPCRTFYEQVFATQPFFAGWRCSILWAGPRR